MVGISGSGAWALYIVNVPNAMPCQGSISAASSGGTSTVLWIETDQIRRGIALGMTAFH